jgi:hypothetical protein
MAMLIAAAACAGLAGCAMSKQTYLPDGRLGHSISCDGTAVSMNYCYEKAGELCGAAGYDLITRENQTSPFGTASVSPSGGFGTYGAMNTKGILVACKK